MTVKIRKYKRGGWEVDIRIERPDGRELRERRKAPVSTKDQALRWGRERERLLLIQPEEKTKSREEVPTLRLFVPRYLDDFARANRQKPSHIYNVELNFKNNTPPVLGSMRLDRIDNRAVQRLKGHLIDRSPKTVNNHLSALNKVLKVAVEWGVIEQMPCQIKLLKVAPPNFTFYEPDQYKRLVEAARKNDQRHEIMIRLGGDAGLRRGEMIGIEWSDIDFVRGEITVERADWRGEETSPKGGRFRRVPMTEGLKSVLKAHRHLRGPRVLYNDDGSTVTAHVLHRWMEKAQRRAGLKVTGGGLHVLRHTFCSLLALRGAPAKAIQELAGHRDLSTTLRYMHLSPAALGSAIKLLESDDDFGDILETDGADLRRGRN